MYIYIYICKHTHTWPGKYVLAMHVYACNHTYIHTYIHTHRNNKITLENLPPNNAAPSTHNPKILNQTDRLHKDCQGQIRQRRIQMTAEIEMEATAIDVVQTDATAIGVVQTDATAIDVVQMDATAIDGILLQIIFFLRLRDHS